MPCVWRVPQWFSVQVLRLRTITMQRRFLVSVLIVEALLLLPIIVIVEGQIRISAHSEFEKRAVALVGNMIAVNRDYLVTYNYLRMDQTLERMVQEHDLLYALIGLYDGEIASYHGAPERRAAAEAQLPLPGAELQAMQITYPSGAALAQSVVAMPIVIEGEYWGFAQAAFSMEGLNHHIVATRWLLLMVGAAVMAVGYLLSYVMAARITKPLARLIEGVEQMARQGDSPPPAMVDDEVHFLSQQFTVMQARIEAQLFELSQRNQQLTALNRRLQAENEQRQRNEAALRESEALLANAQQVAKLGFWEWNLKTHRFRWFPPIAEILAIDLAEQPNNHYAFQQLLAMIHHEDRQRVKHLLDRALLYGQPGAIEYRIETGDGRERHLFLQLSIRHDSHQIPCAILGILQDISDRKATERLQLQQQKMETVGQLSGGVAHDFNNLLGVIAGNLELLTEALAPTLAPDLHQCLEDAASATQSGAELAKRLLTLSRQQSCVAEVVDLHAVVDSLLRLAKRTIPANITLQVERVDAIPQVKVDRSQLENAILNLIVNAYHAMPKGGTITLSTAIEEVAWSDCSEKRGLLTGRYAVITISDEGEGMPDEVLARCLDPFFTTKEVGKGTGLGLSTVYSFLRQAGGDLEIASQVHVGTTVKARLPLINLQRQHQHPPPIPLAAASLRGNETILVVEDQLNLQHLTMRYLQGLGYYTLSAATVEEAMKRLESPYAIDLVVSDIVMPGRLTGVDLWHWIDQRHRGVKVILTTGYAADHLLEEIETAIILPKPYVLSELARRIRHQLNLSRSPFQANGTLA